MLLQGRRCSWWRWATTELEAMARSLRAVVWPGCRNGCPWSVGRSRPHLFAVVGFCCVPSYPCGRGSERGASQRPDRVEGRVDVGGNRFVPTGGEPQHERPVIVGEFHEQESAVGLPLFTVARGDFEHGMPVDPALPECFHL